MTQQERRKVTKELVPFPPPLFGQTVFASTMHSDTFRTSGASILHFTTTETLPHNKAEIFKIIMLP